MSVQSIVTLHYTESRFRNQPRTQSTSLILIPITKINTLLHALSSYVHHLPLISLLD